MFDGMQGSKKSRRKKKKKEKKVAGSNLIGNESERQNVLRCYVSR